MKFLKRHKRSDASEGLPEVVELVSMAIAAHEAKRTLPLPADDGTQPEWQMPKPTDEHRARAQSMLYDFSMQHFSSQVEALRQGAIIEHLANSGRDRTRFVRLFSIGVVATLAAIGLASAASVAAARYGLDEEWAVRVTRELVSLVRMRLGI